MGECGATRINEIPAPYELSIGIQLANLMIGGWSAERCMLRATTSESFPITAGVASYTIGVGKTFNTAKPLSITGAFIRDNYNIDLPLDIVSRDRYDAYEDKQFAQARPISLFYDPGNAQQTSPNFGTIWLYYIPDAASTYTLWIDSDKYLTEFVNPTDNITFETVYWEALVANLAVRLFSHFHGVKVEMPRRMIDAAASTKRKIKTLNVRRAMATVDVPGKALGIYNVYTGQQNNT